MTIFSQETWPNALFCVHGVLKLWDVVFLFTRVELHCNEMLARTCWPDPLKDLLTNCHEISLIVKFKKLLISIK